MADRGKWIQTFSGKQFYALDPQPDDICIEDIAHALSRMCRYAGHCNKFYSVAEHSFLVAENLAPEYQLAGLLHDASEAYLVDIPRPFKSYLGNYYELEEKIMDAIYAKYAITHGFHDEVKKVDNAILIDERHQNLSTHGASDEEWCGIPGIQGMGIQLKFWTPDEAEQQFLAFFDALMERELEQVA